MDAYCRGAVCVCVISKWGKRQTASKSSTACQNGCVCAEESRETGLCCQESLLQEGALVLLLVEWLQLINTCNCRRLTSDQDALVV